MFSSTLDLFFQARAIAVIGASTHREKVGYQILRNLLTTSQKCHQSSKPYKLYPINPTARRILGLPCFTTIMEITEPIEVVIIVTPVGTVRALVEEVIERNRVLPINQRVKAMVIISAGFAEVDEEGKRLQELIATKLLLADIRLLGPNSLGLIHTGHFFNANFAQQDIVAGNLAVISQSGAMLSALFNSLSSRQAGISFAVSLGNKSDVNENDCLRYALDDPNTSAVVLYLESFSHLPTFFELVSLIRRHKPVILLKGGISSRGQAASASHTAALATNQSLLVAAAAQFGFTLVNNMEELLNVAFFLAQYRQLPTNTLIITNAGGPAVNAVDAIQEAKVPLAPWSRRAVDDLEQRLPAIRPTNPLDLLGDADPLRFKLSIEIAQRDQSIESVMIIITPQAVTDIPAIVNQIIAIKGKKPLFVVLMGGDQLEHYRQLLRQHHLICTAFANDVVDMLRILNTTAQTMYLPSRYILSAPHTPTNIMQKGHASETHRRLGHQQGFDRQSIQRPSFADAMLLLKKQNFNIPRNWIVSRDTLQTLTDIKYPVMAKTANLSILHKKKIGALYGRVDSLADAKKAFESMQMFGSEVLYQQFIEIEHELLVGIENDPQFGLYLTVGLGGSYTNLLADRAYCFLPAPRSMIEKAWGKTKAAQFFAKKGVTKSLVIDALVQLQQLVMQHPWIRSVEINPLALSQGKLWVTDIKLQV